jgi:hypothetical protein
MGVSILGWVRNKPRYMLAIFVVASCSYSIDRWFFSGLVANKWIGLPQYEQAIKELQSQSEKWGTAALILGIVALALMLPHWPVEAKADLGRATITASPGPDPWIDYLGRCVVHAAIFLFLTFGLAILIPLAASLFTRF